MTLRTAIAAVLAALLLGGVFAQDLVTPHRVGRPDAPNTFRYSSPPNSSGAHPVPEYAEQFREQFRLWAEANPDWRIDIVTVSPDHGTEQARLLEQARVGLAPECAAVDSYQLPLFINQGVLQPVTEHFTQQEIDSWFPYVREGVTGPDGKVYAFWFNTDLRVLYRNTEYMPTAPRTWDELIEFAQQAIEENPGVTGLLYNGGRNEGTMIDFLAHFWSQGGQLLDAEGRPVFYEEPHRTYLLNALEFFRETQETGVAPARVTTFGHYNDMTAEAIQGNVASFIGVHYQYFQLQEALPAEEAANWEVSPIPAREVGQGATGTGGWTIAALSDDPDVVAACMSFARSVFMGPEQEITGNLPTSQTLFEAMEAFDAPVFDLYREFLGDGQARPGFPIYPEVSNQWQVMIGDVITGAATPEQALDTAARAVQGAYERMIE